MNYYGAKQLAASFRTVRNNTLVIANEIPEEQYGFRITPESRSVAEILAHIALTCEVQELVHGKERLSTLVGFDYFSVMGGIIAREKQPRTKAEVIELLKTSGERYATWMEGLSDEFLGEQVEYPPHMNPPVKSRFEMIMSPKEHEMHHRGQLMVIERVLHITPHMTRQMQEYIAQMQAQQAAKA
jgi:uncharacterized damage-inducible protein DinB